MNYQYPPQSHFVTLEEPDIDGRPQQRPCDCPLGRNHFFDEPVEPAEKSNAAADLMVPRYRDDVTICLYTRFGREHERHTYSYIHPEANGVGWYDCSGLGPDEAGHPYPKRPTVRTGVFTDDLVDDLVEWWHVYATSEVWTPGDLVLPLALDAAARHFVTHAYGLIEQQLKERWKDRVTQVQGEPEAPKPAPVAKEYWRTREGRIARVWPKGSAAPRVRPGFQVCRVLNDRMETSSTFTKGALGDWWFLDNQRLAWHEINKDTSLVEVLPPHARKWFRDDPEPDVPQGFEVARRLPQNSFARYVRLNNGRQDRWVAKEGGDWHTWADIWYGPGDSEIVEVMPGDDDD